MVPRMRSRLLLIALLPLACAEDDVRFASDSGAADVTPSGDSSPSTDNAAPTGDDTHAQPEEDASAEPHPALVGTTPAPWSIRPGVELVTAMGVEPGTRVTLYDAEGTRLVSFPADEYGNVHFAYVSAEYAELDLESAVSGALMKSGRPLAPGEGYVLRDDTTDPPRATAPFRVLSTTDHPDAAFFEAQKLNGVHFGITGVVGDGDVNDGFNYIEMRDGVKLSAMVRLPDPALWGPGPYPTVVTYSGYSPSRHSSPDPIAGFATVLGYAAVGVNMRGTGCSGGVFDVFSPAQHADGYDIIEAVARQPWVMHNHVGMIGVSYPGISQLYVAYLNPPSLAAITPMSVLLDPWIVLRPGGIYNDGFTRQWLSERDEEAAAGGQSWTDLRIEDGDTICAEHQILRHQNFKFEEMFKSLEYFPEAGLPRSIQRFVHSIEAPVYLTGAFQDEQTGPQFMDMLGNFTDAAVRRFILYNGRHGDALAPMVVTRWYEFLELYVAKRVPRLPEYMRTLGAAQLSDVFESQGLTLEPDRFAEFADDDYQGVLDVYEVEPEVRVLFESGGGAEQPGAPVQRFEATWESWPPPDADTLRLHLGDGELLADSPATAGSSTWVHDPDSGKKTFFGPKGYQFSARLWDIDWTRFAADGAARFTTPPLTEQVVLAGPAYLEAYVSSEATELHLQVTLSEVRPDGQEVLLGTGWHRVGHDKEDPELSQGNFVLYTYAEQDFSPLTPSEPRKVRVPLPGFGHALRAGTRLRATVSTPGRDHGTWEFTNPSYDGALPKHTLAWGGATPSALVLSTVALSNVPADYPACPGLRGQACRPAE